MKIKAVLFGMGLLAAVPSMGQSPRDEYEAFRAQAQKKFESFRDECNSRYADFLARSWQQVKVSPAIPRPEEAPPVPPVPYDEDDRRDDGRSPVDVTPVVIPTPDTRPVPQPTPVSPVDEDPFAATRPVAVSFYELTPKVRVPELRFNLGRRRPEDVAAAWKALSADSRLNNTIRDCLDVRSRYGLSDWAYLQFLDRLAQTVTRDSNEAAFLMAYLFCQSGYQMRLAEDSGRIFMLFGSRHLLFNTPRFIIDDVNFYPYGASTQTLSVSNSIFDGEIPMSFRIETEQKLGDSLTEPRRISSARYDDVSVTSRVPKALLTFFESYPDSKYGDNFLTQWAIYANTPLAEATKKLIYPDLAKAIEGLSELEKVERLLNLVQTGFKYDYDTNVWGRERAFFAEETLYYPYDDCEDRAILFSRLVRDLVGLDVALVYYPGHLATAICFNDPVRGDALQIDGRRFVIADPTYVNAPVGQQMPDLNYSAIKAIVL